MVSQAELIITFIFNRSGKTELSFSEMYLTLSMDLNWFTPDDAKDFVEKAIKEGYLKEKNSQICPLFDISKVSVPIGYSPTGELFEKKKASESKQKEQSVLDKIVDKISKETKEDKKHIYGKIKEIGKEKDITLEIAAVSIAKNYKNISKQLYKKIEEEILRKS
jgi:hypothetical protein